MYFLDIGIVNQGFEVRQNILARVKFESCSFDGEAERVCYRGWTREFNSRHVLKSLVVFWNDTLCSETKMKVFLFNAFLVSSLQITTKRRKLFRAETLGFLPTLWTTIFAQGY
jgi:hypothetical protein